MERTFAPGTRGRPIMVCTRDPIMRTSVISILSSISTTSVEILSATIISSYNDTVNEVCKFLEAIKKLNCIFDLQLRLYIDILKI